METSGTRTFTFNIQFDHHHSKSIRANGTHPKWEMGVPVVAQWKRTQLGTMRLQVRSLASLSGLRIQRCRELCVGCRHGLFLLWLWLWRRPAAVAPGRPLAWELPYATGVALKEKTKKKISIWLYRLKLATLDIHYWAVFRLWECHGVKTFHLSESVFGKFFVFLRDILLKYKIQN